MLREIWAGSPSQGKPSVFKKGQPGPQGASMMGHTQASQPVSGVWFPSSATSPSLSLSALTSPCLIGHRRLTEPSLV